MTPSQTEDAQLYALVAEDFAANCLIDMARMHEQVEQYARETPHRRRGVRTTDPECDNPETCARCALERVLRHVFKVTPPVVPG